MELDLRYRNGGNPDLLDLVDIRPGRALDCGCGAGDNARLLRERGWQVTGVTNDPSERAAAGRECDRIELADLADGLPFAPDGSYELVVLSHILEHLADPTPLVREARRVLAPDGRILVALPNVLHYRQRAKFLLGHFEYTETGLMDATHLRFFTVTSARRLLVSGGLRILADASTGGLPWWRSREFLPEGWVRGADRFVLRQMPNLYAWQSLFLTAPLRPLPAARPADIGTRPVTAPRPRRNAAQPAATAPTVTAPAPAAPTAAAPTAAASAAAPTRSPVARAGG
ncbi:class I SAM-dependent methyltransferase [Frankia sp. AgPm24]|uniref:class I SAM-dependent methyltransferase n=1 Tax=Frankia sp. AgPm24 TaxID=631128 RepID=UPI00200D0CF0|nr:class I SAM-dependent methyltransferase [Frankia sp. AgPm24]MCK9920314.1 class I SAM-dependent methyltransferase [Frankia sp. AgPm24]